MKFVLVLASAIVATSLAIRVRLDKKDCIYIAADHGDDGIGSDFQYDSRLADMVAVDEKRKLIYTAASDQITVMRITPIKTLEVIHSHKFPDNQFKMVQVCKGFVTVTARDLVNKENGRILVFLPYNRRRGNMMNHLIHSIPIGPVPVNHAHYRGCRKIIAAVEGIGDEFDGSIAIITFMGKRFRNPQVKTLTFDAFESQLATLEMQWFLRDPGIDFTKQIEPESICVNDKGTTAYVIMQENNAIAVVDLKHKQETISGLFGLGIKNWATGQGTMGLDPTSNPQEVSIANHPVYSAYMPSKISCMTIKKQDCVFYANEGDAFEGTNTSVGDSTLANPLSEPLDDLQILDESTIADPNGDGTLDFAVTQGSRSFSVRCGSPAITADTQSDLEKRTAMLGPLFNSFPAADETILDSFDSTSITIGPGPQSVETFRACKGRYVVMIGGLTNPGAIVVYTLDTRNLAAGFEFQDIVHGYRDLSGTMTDEQLYDAGLLTLKDPRGARITSGRKTRGRRMLVTGSFRSSSVDLFDIRINCKAINTSANLQVAMPVTTPDPDDPLDI